jgi:hypothetical protein
MSDDRVTIGDVRRAGYCVRGVRRWFDETGRDFRTFVREGMPIEEARAIDDVVVQDVIRKKTGAAHG